MSQRHPALCLVCILFTITFHDTGTKAEVDSCADELSLLQVKQLNTTNVTNGGDPATDQKMLTADVANKTLGAVTDVLEADSKTLDAAGVNETKWIPSIWKRGEVHVKVYPLRSRKFPTLEINGMSVGRRFFGRWRNTADDGRFRRLGRWRNTADDGDSYKNCKPTTIMIWIKRAYDLAQEKDKRKKEQTFKTYISASFAETYVKKDEVLNTNAELSLDKDNLAWYFSKQMYYDCQKLLCFHRIGLDPKGVRTVVDTTCLQMSEAPGSDFSSNLKFPKGGFLEIDVTYPYTGGKGPYISSSCFPGEAQVATPRGPVDIADIAVGDEVLVEAAHGQLVFAPVLTFIHRIPEGHLNEYIAVVHKSGTFRASPNHIVFTCGGTRGRIEKLVGDLRPGDMLCAVNDITVTPSEIFHVEQHSGVHGMVAPLTRTGTLVVDGVVASNYATPSMGIALPHDLAHNAMLPLGLYYSHGLNMLLTPVWDMVCHILMWDKACAANSELEIHPYAAKLRDAVHLERFVGIRAS